MSNQEIAGHRGSEIAIIGMAGRFPGSSDLPGFWHNLRRGVESISVFSDEELAASGVEPSLYQNPGYVRAGGILAGIELFDATLFGFSPREAALTDPQHRLFLECAWEALEHAAHDPARDDSIGVFAGAGRSDYGTFDPLSIRDRVGAADFFELEIATANDYLPMRVSYKLNLKGPSINVQTTCSTSLVAVHLACQSLLGGECDLALAGGVSITAPQKIGYLYQEGGVLSPDGHCRAFAATARGFVGGHGVGVVVLRRLAEALAAGDVVHAVIKGSAINNDGAAKVGFTAPGVSGQAAVIEEAQAVAGVDPKTVTYVEAHGTATPLGDPVEVAALTQAFRAGTPDRGYCALGSVKTNVGHLGEAAGVAGLIKTVLALEHQELPPSLHCEEPNPRIDFASSPFYVNTALRPWPREKTPRRAGVSSFGLGGTNVHVVLEEAPGALGMGGGVSPCHKGGSRGDPRCCQLLLLSARTEAALEAATSRLAVFLRHHPELDPADVAFTLQVGRSELEHRRMLVCRGREDAAAALEARDPKRLRSGYPKRRQRPVVFLFPGGGAQYPRMGLELYRTEPVFRRHVDHCAELFAPHLGSDLRAVLYPADDGLEEAREQLRGSSLALPALFLTEYALARLWTTWGIEPQAMIGHSLGEYVAACLSGVLSLADAVSLVALRGRLLASLPRGAMLSVPLPEAEVRKLIGDRLSLAAVNGPSQCVVSGPQAAVAELARALAARDLEARPLAIEVAGHSSLVDPILEEFAAGARKLRFAAPRIPYVSNLTGDWITAREATDPDYWVRHLRHTVRFAAGLEKLVAETGGAGLEVGPGRTLTTLARQQSGATVSEVLLTSLPHPQDPQPAAAWLLTTLGRLWLAGVAVDWSAYHGDAPRRRVELPTYPFERRRYWIGPATAKPADRQPAGKIPEPSEWLYLPVWRPSSLAVDAKTAVAEPAAWLVFTAEDALGSRLAERLREPVIRIFPGTGFRRLGNHTYTLDPREPAGYRALLDELDLAGGPLGIVHLWSLTGGGDGAPDAAAFSQAQELGFFSLLLLVQALDAVGVTTPVRLVVVSDHMQEVTGEETLRPEKATVLGACRVIPQEYANMTCRSIDVTLPPAGSWRQRRLLGQLTREVTMPAAGATVAYRGNRRWIQDFERIRPENGDPSGLRERGVYLITGGLGGVGLIVAEYLARTVRARLILTGRCGLPPREEWERWLARHGDEDLQSCRIRKVKALEALGSEVEVVAADVADRAAMRRVVARAEKRWGRICGVVHAAAFTGAEFLSTLHDTRRSDSERHFRPKVHGLFVLEEILRGKELDFCLLTSSVASILGGIGRASYAAANLFMDAFAQRQSHTNAVPWISVNWDVWRPEEETVQQGAFGAELTQLGMTPDEGTETLSRILAADLSGQVVVSTSHLNRRIDRRVGLEARPPETRPPEPESAAHRRTGFDNPYVAPRNEPERIIVGIWQELLGIAEVGVHDNFFELGGHSLLATQVLSRLRRRHGFELPLSRFFEATTVAEIAQAVTADGREGPGREGPGKIPPITADDLEELSL